jgi:hypothetical protein
MAVSRVFFDCSTAFCKSKASEDPSDGQTLRTDLEEHEGAVPAVPRINVPCVADGPVQPSVWSRPTSFKPKVLPFVSPNDSILNLIEPVVHSAAEPQGQRPQTVQVSRH